MNDFATWAGEGRYATILDGLEVDMRLGIHPEELARSQRVRLTVTLYVDYGEAPPGDEATLIPPLRRCSLASAATGNSGSVVFRQSLSYPSCGSRAYRQDCRAHHDRRSE